jgi:hypothetical protein
MTHAQIMQTARQFHGEIRKGGLGIAQGVFHNPCPLGTADTMFHAHPNARQVPIVAFLARR